MSVASARARNRATAALLAAAFTVLSVGLGAPTAWAATSDRLAGENRYATAARIAQATFPEGAADVVLATGENYPDALAAAGIAGMLGAPVLLTDGQRLSPETVVALDALDPARVHLTGGTAAVADAVENDVLADGRVVERYAGGTRYETAAKIATAIGAEGVAEGTAIVTTGQNFADAVVAGPLASAGPHPVLLVERDRVPDATRAALEALEISDVIVVGGTTVVSPDVGRELEAITGDAEIVRLGGANRAETAVRVAEHTLAHAGFSASTVLLANGWQNLGVDALAGGPHGGTLGAPLLFVAEDRMPVETAEFLTDHAAAIDVVRVFGGTSVVADAVLAAATAAATPAAGETNATLTVTPASADAVPLGTTRTFAVENAAAGVEHTIELVDASRVSVSPDGTITFSDDGFGAAAVGSTNGGLLMVNGMSTAGRPTSARSHPAGGNLTFTVTADAPSAVVPVVFVDADGDGMLDLDGEGRPVAGEAFGIGGRTDWIPAEADGNAVVSGTVAAVGDGFATIDPDADGGGDAVSVFFHADDTYRLQAGAFCGATSASAFHTELSVGDQLRTVLDEAGTPGPYHRDGATGYCLEDVAPAAPTGVTASDVTHLGATLSWTPTADADGYTILANAEACASTTVDELAELATAISSPFMVDVLTPATDHCVAVQAVSGSDTSPPATVDVRTLEEPDTIRPFLTSARVQDDSVWVGHVSAADSWRLVTSEPLSSDVKTSGQLRLRDGDGDEIQAVCGHRVNSDDSVTSLTCENPSLGEDDVLVLSLGEAPEDRNAGGDGTVTYPLTIVSHTDFTDGLNPLDLDVSLDVEID